MVLLPYDVEVLWCGIVSSWCCAQGWERVYPHGKTICTGPELFNKKLKHLTEALYKCKYPKWAIDEVQSMFLNSNWEEGNTQEGTNEEGAGSTNSNTTERTPQDKPSIEHIVIPDTQGLGESIKKVCNKYGMQTHFKENRTLKQLSVEPKDQDPIDKKSGAIYMYQCGEVTCDEEYVGETSRTLRERYKQHLKEPSPIHMHNTHWTQYHTRELQHHREGGPWHSQDYKSI